MFDEDLYTEFAWADEDIAQRALYADIVLLGPDAAEDADLRKRIFDHRAVENKPGQAQDWPGLFIEIAGGERFSPSRHLGSLTVVTRIVRAIVAVVAAVVRIVARICVS